MRQNPPSESPQIGQATPLVSQTVDTATLDLLTSWQEEDATSDPAQRQAAKDELATFIEALNSARTKTGESLIYS